MKNNKTCSPIGTYQVQSSSLKASEFLLTECSVGQNKNPQSSMKHDRADTVTLYTLPTTNWLPAVWLPQFLFQDDKNPVSPPLRRPSKKDGPQEIKPVRSFPGRADKLVSRETQTWSQLSCSSIGHTVTSEWQVRAASGFVPAITVFPLNPKTVPLLRFHWVQAATS